MPSKLSFMLRRKAKRSTKKEIPTTQKSYLQATMIFPSTVMDMIAKEYVSIFKASKDKTVKIIPLLTSCHLVSDLAMPHLYSAIIFTSATKFTSFVKYASPAHAFKIRKFHFQVSVINMEVDEVRELFDSFKESVETYRKQNFANSIKRGTNKESIGDELSMRVTECSGGNLGVRHLAFLNPIILSTSDELVWSLIQDGLLPRLSTLNLAYPTLHLDRPFPDAKEGSLEILHFRLLIVADAWHSIDRGSTEVIDNMVKFLKARVASKIAKKVEVSIMNWKHTFCFNDILQEVITQDGIVLKRGCPAGVRCSAITNSSCDSLVSVVRQAFRPEKPSECHLDT